MVSISKGYAKHVQSISRARAEHIKTSGHIVPVTVTVTELITEIVIRKVKKMSSTNSVNIVGRLTRDAELRYTPDGLAITSFTVAVDRYRKKGEKDTDFVPVKTFGKQAEFVEKWTGKGLMVSVHGRLKFDSYTDKDGKKQRYAEVIADDVTPIEWRKQEDFNEAAFTF